MDELTKRLKQIVDKVEEYPVDDGQLCRLCEEHSAPAEISGFFERMPGTVQFHDAEDILVRFQEARLFAEEQKGRPAERIIDEP